MFFIQGFIALFSKRVGAKEVEVDLATPSVNCLYELIGLCPVN